MFRTHGYTIVVRFSYYLDCLAGIVGTSKIHRKRVEEPQDPVLTQNSRKLRMFLPSITNQDKKAYRVHVYPKFYLCLVHARGFLAIFIIGICGNSTFIFKIVVFHYILGC